MLEKCHECPDYKKGKGTRRCLSCPQFKTVTPRQKPCVNYSLIPREILEGLSIPLEIDIYNVVEPAEATILFQRYHLGLKLREIAELQDISKQAVDKKIKNTLIKIQTYIRETMI